MNAPNNRLPGGINNGAAIAQGQLLGSGLQGEENWTPNRLSARIYLIWRVLQAEHVKIRVKPFKV